MAFNEIKAYYNDITRDNLKLIKDLKDEVAEMKSKASSSQRLMMEIAQVCCSPNALRSCVIM